MFTTASVIARGALLGRATDLAFHRKEKSMESLGNGQVSTWNTQPALRKKLPPKRGTQPWTTTRCHRLLRPLKTHISALRREIELENSQRLSEGADGNAIEGIVGGVNLDKSKVQHTYSRKGRRPKRSNGEKFLQLHGHRFSRKTLVSR